MQKSKIKDQKLAQSLKMFLGICVVALLFALCSLHLSKANAAAFDLSVSPPIFQIELTPPAVVDAKQKIVLENTSDQPLDLKILYRPFRPKGENGEVEYLTGDKFAGNDPLIFQRISLLQDGGKVTELHVPPKSKRELSLTVTIPKDEPPSDYYFTIVFLSQSPQSPSSPRSSSTIASGGVGVNVLLSIGPKTKTRGSIEEFSTKFLQTQGPVPFVVRIKNNSSHFIYPKANIVIKNMFGQTIGKVELLPVNILADSTRSLPSKEQFMFAAQAEACKAQSAKCTESEKENAKRYVLGAIPLALWPETFLLGPYTAVLTVALSDQGPLYVRSITFVGFPLQILAGFGIAIGLVLVIRSRLKHRQ